MADLPEWRRAAFRELDFWLRTPPTQRAVLLSGARQVGKTTLLLQAVEGLSSSGVPPQNILYATFDHPLLKLGGLDGIVKLWRDMSRRWTALSICSSMRSSSRGTGKHG